MKSFTIVWKILAVLAMMGILAACSAAPTATPVTPTVDPKPTFDAIQTQAASTVVANLTLTAPTAAPPTETPLPTNTPEPTATLGPTNTPLPTETPTRVFIPWTKTPTLAPAEYACQVTSVTRSPSSVKVNDSFDTTWALKNTGTKTWSSGDLDVRFSDGDKLQSKGDLYDLGHDVAPNGTISVTVDMKAPANDGTYKTTWKINFPDGNACVLSTSVNVSK